MTLDSNERGPGFKTQWSNNINFGVRSVGLYARQGRDSKGGMALRSLVKDRSTGRQWLNGAVGMQPVMSYQGEQDT